MIVWAIHAIGALFASICIPRWGWKRDRHISNVGRFENVWKIVRFSCRISRLLLWLHILRLQTAKATLQIRANVLAQPALAVPPLLEKPLEQFWNPLIFIKTEKGTRGLLSFGLEMVSFSHWDVSWPHLHSNTLPTAIAPGELLQGHLSSHLLFPYIYINRFQWCHHWYCILFCIFLQSSPRLKKWHPHRKSPFLTTTFSRDFFV